MFGRKSKLTPAGRVFAAIVALACGWGAIKLSVIGWVEATNVGMGEENDLTYGSTFYDWHGNFGVRDARLVHQLPDGNEAVFLVDRITVHPPGFWWLFRNSWFRTSKDLPETVTLTLENPRNAADGNDTPGNYSNLPYDSTGCGDKQLTPADYVAMGLPRPARNATITLTAVDDARSALHFAMDTPGSGELAMDFDIGFQRPVTWRNTLITLQAAPVRHIAMTMHDTGFVKARNTYCAGRAGIPAAAFAEHNAGVLSQRLRATGEDFSAPVWDRYRQFVANGGTIQLATTSERPLPLWSFITMDRGHKFRAFPMLLAVDGGARTVFAYEPVGASAVTPAGSALAEDLDAVPAAPAPAAAVAVSLATPTSVPLLPASASAPAPAPQARREVEYRALEHMVGSHLEVVTINGTVRHGTLVAYAPLMSNLRLDRDEGGFTLSLPAESISVVTLLAVAGTPSQAKPDAQTN